MRKYLSYNTHFHIVAIIRKNIYNFKKPRQEPDKLDPVLARYNCCKSFICITCSEIQIAILQTCLYWFNIIVLSCAAVFCYFVRILLLTTLDCYSVVYVKKLLLRTVMLVTILMSCLVLFCSFWETF